MQRIISVLLLCAIWSPELLAWGQTGHRVVGAIADSYLTDETRQQIQLILGKESLARASTWPDEMRSNPDPFWKKNSGPWHYVTVPKGKNYADIKTPKWGDAVTALTKFRGTILNPNASLEDKQLALRFIIHIVGDLHQPLHAGDGTDRGGNDFKVEFFWEDTNLHSVWDSRLIDKQQLSYSEWTDWLLDSITEQERKTWNSTDPLVWIQESTEMRDRIYPDKKEINWQYAYDHLPTVRVRLKQAGVRLGDYLNELFSKTNPAKKLK